MNLFEDCASGPLAQLSQHILSEIARLFDPAHRSEEALGSCGSARERHAQRRSEELSLLAKLEQQLSTLGGVKTGVERLKVAATILSCNTLPREIARSAGWSMLQELAALADDETLQGTELANLRAFFQIDSPAPTVSEIASCLLADRERSLARLTGESSYDARSSLEAWRAIGGSFEPNEIIFAFAVDLAKLGKELQGPFIFKLPNGKLSLDEFRDVMSEILFTPTASVTLHFKGAEVCVSSSGSSESDAFLAKLEEFAS